MKKCTKCGIEKPLTEFHKEKAKKDGHRPNCKACSAEYYAQNKEKLDQYAAEYYVQNKEKISQQSAEYYAQNKEKMNQQHAEQYVDRKAEQPGCVYQISNSTSNRFYIGQTTRGELRWKGHLNKLRGNRHSNHKLQQDFNEHGEDAFEWSIIKELAKNLNRCLISALLLQETIEVQRRINNGEELYNLMLTIDQMKMLTEHKEIK